MEARRLMEEKAERMKKEDEARKFVSFFGTTA